MISESGSVSAVVPPAKFAVVAGEVDGANRGAHDQLVAGEDCVAEAGAQVAAPDHVAIGIAPGEHALLAGDHAAALQRHQRREPAGDLLLGEGLAGVGGVPRRSDAVAPTDGPGRRELRGLGAATAAGGGAVDAAD